MEAVAARRRVLADLHADQRVIDVGGVATSLLEAGAGAPVVLLHGAIECGGAMWAPVLGHVARDHRVLVPDVPGLGESAPVQALDGDVLDRWLVAMLHHVRAYRPMLVAHSALGAAACRVAARHRELLGQLVVYAAPSAGPYRAPLRLRYVALRAALRPTPRNTERFDRFALLDLDATRRRDPGWYEAFSAYTAARGRVPHVQRAMRALITTQTTPVPDATLSRIAAPTALVWGRADRMVPLALAERAAVRHGWPLHVIDDAGHAPHLEQPEGFLAALSAIEAAGGRTGGPAPGTSAPGPARRRETGSWVSTRSAARTPRW